LGFGFEFLRMAESERRIAVGDEHLVQSKRKNLSIYDYGFLMKGNIFK